MARRERGRLVQEEQLGEPAGLQEWLAVPAAEPEPARDPSPACIRSADPASVVVQASTVPVDEPPAGFGD
jgi:hypothetical protein